MKHALTWRLTLAVAGLALLVATPARAGFATGDIFASYNEGANTNSVFQYNSSGAYIGSMSIPSSSIYWSTRGLAVGPDGLLYVVQDRFLDGFAVLAYNSSGVLEHTYTYNGTGDYLGGNIFYGQISFDSSGHFYVGSGGGLVQFTVGSPSSGSLFFAQSSNGIFAVTAGPNGHLLAASAYDIYELNQSGQVVRDLTQGGTGPNAVQFGDLRGVAYNPSTGALYATMLGYTGHSDQIMKIDYATGGLLASTTFTYAADTFLQANGALLVGSRTQTPNSFDGNLNSLGSLTGGPSSAIFVTQDIPVSQSIPEPSSLTLLGVGTVVALAGLRRRRSI